MPIVEQRNSEKFTHYNDQICQQDTDDDNTVGDSSPTSLVSPTSLNHRRNPSYATTTKEFDPVTFCVTKVDPKDFASQLTLLDLPVFKAIKPEELTSCAWNTKEKLLITPNVVAFTRRFNQVCLWCQKEILNRDKVKTRAEILAHFIRIAKKLMQLNNLHSTFAIISGLQSNAVYPLSKTWAELSNKERSTFDKLSKLFSDENNFDRLRKYMDSVKLPCIPYLGLYLTDLIYIDVAHPSSGGLDSSQRSLLMNNILRVLSDFQHSTYDNLIFLEYLQNYLKSVRYIDELQKFVEEDLYNKSIELEPRPQRDSSFNSGLLVAAPPGGAHDLSNLSIGKTYAYAANLKMPHAYNKEKGGGGIEHQLIINEPITDEEGGGATTGCLATAKGRKNSATANQKSVNLFASDNSHQLQISIKNSKANSLTPQCTKFKSGHRKTLSLGANLPKSGCRYTNESFNRNETLPTVIDGRRHLLDDSLLDFSTCTTSTLSSTHAPIHEHTEDSGNESEHHELVKKEPDCSISRTISHEPILAARTGIAGGVIEEDSSTSDYANFSGTTPDSLVFEGPVRKKTIMKNGVKKSVFFPVYTRYWLRLRSSTVLSFYASKKLSIRNLESKVSYRTKPAESISIADWMILEPDGPYHKDTFYLQEPTKGIVYKIRAGNESKAREWTRNLKTVIENHKKSLRPSNLMTFD